MRSLARLTPCLLLLASGCARPATPPAAATPAPARAATVSPPAAPADTAAESRARAAAILARSVEALGGRDAVMRADAAELELESRGLQPNSNQARDWRDTTPNPNPTRLHLLVDAARRQAIIESNSSSSLVATW